MRDQPRFHPHGAHALPVGARDRDIVIVMGWLEEDGLADDARTMLENMLRDLSI